MAFNVKNTFNKAKKGIQSLTQNNPIQSVNPVNLLRKNKEVSSGVKQPEATSTKSSGPKVVEPKLGNFDALKSTPAKTTTPEAKIGNFDTMLASPAKGLEGLTGTERQRAIEQQAGIGPETRQTNVRATLASTPSTTSTTTTLAATPDTTVNRTTVGSGDLSALRGGRPASASQAGTGAITPEERIRRVQAKEAARSGTNDLQAQYLNLLKPSAEEQSLADELAAFDEAAQLGISNLEGQGRGISLDLIRGEQGKLAQQAEIKRQTILDRLANATAQRQAEASALQAQLGFQQQQDQLDLQRQQMAFQQSQANQPFEFNGNLVQLDPATGQLKTIAEGATVVPGTDDMQEYQFAVQTGFGGSFLDYLQAKSGGGSGFSLSPGQTRFDQFGNPIATAFDPEAAQEVQAQQQAQIQQAQGMASKVELLDGILNNTSGINTAVGTGLFSRSGLNKGAQQRLLADVEQLISRDTLDSLINLKAQGGTLGALSDSELALLQSSANKISTWLEDDKIKAKESDFISEINRIKGLTLKALDSSASGGLYTTMLNNGSMTPEEYQDVVMGLAYQPSFSQDLSTSQNGSVLSLGAITGYGSPLWEHGLDIDLKKGDPVPSPASGVVTYVGPNGGFGNQVKVMDQFGNEHWLSHLDATGVQVGQQIAKGSLVGLGGNSGSTIPGPNGDGSHLDYTVVNAQGQYIPPAQIEQYVRNNAFV